MFTRIDTIRELAITMFGQTESEYDRILVHHLARSGIVLDPEVEPPPLTWREAGELAGMVDAYALAEDAELGDPGELAILKRAEAQRTGEWRGSALELWVTVCMERLWDKWQSEGAIGLNMSFSPLPMLDDLARAFGERLAKLGWPRRRE